jgi:lactoylglutathione lyase
MKILVVDDQRFNLAVSQEYIKNLDMDCDALVCRDPVECFDIVANEKPDVILLDLVMEPISGIDVLRKLREDPQNDDIAIVMFTGFSDRESIQQCYALGANDYINKPVAETEFKARMKVLIDHRKTLLELERMNEEMRELRQQLAKNSSQNKKRGEPRPRFKFAHNNLNVFNLEKSVAFYHEALGLSVVNTVEPDDKSFKLAFMSDETSGHLLELTWLKERTAPYNLGDNEIHMAFAADHYDAAYQRHKKMGCICYENKAMGIYFISDPDGYWSEIVPERR